MNRTRNLIADVLVGVALVLVIVWVLRRVLGLVVWLVSTIAFVLVVLGLLAIASSIRKGSRRT